MNRKIRPLAVVQVASILVLMLLALGSSARAQVSGGATPTGRQGGQNQAGLAPSTDGEPLAASAYLQMTGTALRAENTAEVEASAEFIRFGCLYAVSGATDSFFSAPVFPPKGSTLTMLRVYVHDASDATGRAALEVVDEYGYEASGWNGASVGNSGDSYFDIPVSNHVVDYANYSYQVWWQPYQLGTSMMLCGMRLYYLPEGGFVHLPAVMKEP